SVENARVRRDGFTTGKADRKETRVFAWGARGGQKAGEKGVVGRGGEIAGGVPLLPDPVRQHGREVGGTSLGQTVPGYVVPPRVDRHEEHVVRADQFVRVNHAGTPHGFRTRWSMAIISVAYVSKPSWVTPGSRSPKALISSSAWRR